MPYLGVELDGRSVDLGGRQFSDRPVIGLDTAVFSGGVMLSHTALVMDFGRQPEAYEELYERVVGRLDDDAPLAVGQAINAAIQERLPFDKEKVAAVLKKAAAEAGKKRVGWMDEIGLSEYIKEGGGMCHQHAATAAVMSLFLRERLNIDVAPEINRLPGPLGHAWLRNASRHGERVVAVDPAQNYVADLAEDHAWGTRIYRRGIGRHLPWLDRAGT